MTHYNISRNPHTLGNRQAWHGRLVPMERPEGELGIRAGASFLITLFLVATLFVVAFGS